MKKIYIIYRNFLRDDKKTLSIGGIQTYILNLCEVIKSLNHTPVIVQISKERFRTSYEGMDVYGFVATDSTLADVAIKQLTIKDSPIIFGSHELIVTYAGPSIAIQHGITWDTPVHLELKPMYNSLYVFQRARMAYGVLRIISKVNHLICVDYNFINWYRTQVAYPATKMTAIPNFAVPQENIIKPKGVINLIFARRLFWYRGTRLFMDIMQELLEEHHNLHITIAGEGEDEPLFKEKFLKHERVNLIHYRSEDSYKVHSDKHIAIVPTLGSEGTSLSLLEAMASRCAVVCTNVGGMSNIVINNYNGLIISPEKRCLKDAIVRLINDDLLRENLSNRAYDTIKNAFNLDSWKEAWSQVLKNEFN